MRYTNRHFTYLLTISPRTGKLSKSIKVVKWRNLQASRLRPCSESSAQSHVRASYASAATTWTSELLGPSRLSVRPGTESNIGTTSSPQRSRYEFTTTTFRFCSSSLFFCFPVLGWVTQKPLKYNIYGLPEAWFLQARCPSCHPTNSVKALKTYSYKTRSIWIAQTSSKAGHSSSIVYNPKVHFSTL